MKGTARKAAGGIGKLIRAYRAVHDLDLRQFGNTVGLSAPTIMRIEQGHTMNAHTWLKLQQWMIRLTGDRC